MQKLSTLTFTLRRFLRNEDGATAIEYAMIAAGIAVAVVGVVTAPGTSVSGMFTKVQSAYPG